MPKDDGLTWVNAQFDADRLADLEAIQDYHGIASRTETIRFLVRTEARRIAAVAPAIRDLAAAALAGTITADEAIQAIAGHGDLS